MRLLSNTGKMNEQSLEMYGTESLLIEEEWEGLPKNELILLILQTIHGMGYRKAVSALEEEAGVLLETAAVSRLHNSISTGKWDDVLHALKDLKLGDIIVKACSFLILEQKFLELLYEQNLQGALQCLRGELCKASFDEDTIERLHKCCRFFICHDLEELQRKAQWIYKSSRQVLWHRIQQLVPPNVIPPPKRLAVLIHQGRKLQELRCMYHNVSISKNNYYSLLEDHECPRHSLPTNCIAYLDAHTDEVWNVAVSNSGKFIASSSKDKSIILWDTTNASFSTIRRWCAHEEAISYVAWSPDDRFLASASNDRSIIIWRPQDDAYFAKIDGHTESVTAVVWLSDSQHIISTGFDRQLILWKINTEVTPYFSMVYKWALCFRLQDCVVTSDGDICIVASDRTIRVVDINARKEKFCLSETEPVTSITASTLNKQVLVNISDQKPIIRLWDLNERRIIQRYRGHKQGRFVVRSAFGGPNETFVLSGSEDSQIYIWHRFFGSLLEVLPGHAGTVNAVIWPGKMNCPWMISASDDHTLLIWHTEPALNKYPNEDSNEDSVEICK